jgi:MFS transporter, FSR family, fosmidomycin resistance protein
MQIALSQKWLFRSICIGHFVVDTFNAMGPVILAFISGHIMGLSNTQIGLAISLYQIAGAFSQPFFGLAADKSGGRYLGTFGVLWTIGFLVLSTLGAATGIYEVMLVPFVIAALGSGAFHPIGAMYATEVDKSRAQHYTSLFFLSGQLGGGVGPTLIGVLLDAFATRNTIFTDTLGPRFSNLLIEHGTLAPVAALGLLALPGVLLMLFTLPTRMKWIETHPPRPKGSGGLAAPLATGLIAYLAINIALRALSNPGSAAFIPRIFALKGWPASEYGILTGAFWLSGGIAGVIFARWASRFGSRAIIAVTLIMGGPLMLLLPRAETVGIALVMTLLVGALTGGSHSLLVVMAQQLLPARKGFISGLSLGYMFGMGAVGTLLIGALGDRVGLEAAYQFVGIVTVVAGIMALRLPSDAALASSAAANAAHQDALNDRARSPEAADARA